MKAREELERQGSLHWFHWAIIAMSLVLTLTAWYFTKHSVEEKRYYIFQKEAKQIIGLVKERMDNYVDALQGGVALLDINNGFVSFAKWKNYVDKLNIVNRYPGINGMGVIYKVSPSKLEEFIKTQQEYRPSFTIYPKEDRPMYLPITYIAPVAGNDLAIGLDVAFEKNRYNAALLSINSGEVQITAPIALVQDKIKAPGFLLYAPFYKGEPTDERERIKNFIGMVYAPFTFKRLMAGVLSHAKRNVKLKIYDGKTVLYDEDGNNGDNREPGGLYHYKKKIDVYGRQWSFDVRSTVDYQTLVSNAQPMTILIGGIIIDIILVFLFLGISNANKKALVMADRMTKEVREKAKRLQHTNRELLATRESYEKIMHYDSITGLPNRNSFLEYLGKALARAKHNESFLAVCFLDIDKFKAVNENLGHDSGDLLLRLIPKRILPRLKEVDYLARIGNDEFGLILESVSSTSQVLDILNSLEKIFNAPVKLSNKEIRCTLSIGVASYPSAGNSSDELIKNADIAMVKAKEGTKRCYAFFDDETNYTVQRSHSIELAIAKAIQNNEFYLVYQPQLSANNEKLVGVEVLLRWYNQELNHVLPEEFIPIAEKARLIEDVGYWVLDKIGQDYTKLQNLSDELKISINASIRELESTSYPKRLNLIMKKYKIPPQRLTIEVTETAAMLNNNRIIRIMRQIKEMGISFALDDFGTGYSSMNYLRHMPIETIKIDKSFVIGLEKDISSQAIIKGIIKFAKALGYKTIAEGVETELAYSFLKKNGCELLQGYYFDHPMLLDKLIDRYSCN